MVRESKLRRIYHFRESAWAIMTAKIISKHIRNFRNKNGFCNIALTGGSSAKLIYKELARRNFFKKLNSLDIYFTDERCVSVGHADSNYQMVVNSLFRGNSNFYAHDLHRIKGECKNLAFVLREYSHKIPHRLDVLILSLGIDGHIASIFPEESVHYSVHAKVRVSSCLQHPYTRITISQRVIENARKIFVLVNGSQKRNIFNAMQSGELNNFIPAHLIPDRAIWLIDDGI